MFSIMEIPRIPEQRRPAARFALGLNQRQLLTQERTQRKLRHESVQIDRAFHRDGIVMPHDLFSGLDRNVETSVIDAFVRRR